ATATGPVVVIVVVFVFGPRPSSCAILVIFILGLVALELAAVAHLLPRIAAHPPPLALLLLDRVGRGHDDREDHGRQQGRQEAREPEEHAEPESHPGHLLVAANQPDPQRQSAAQGPGEQPDDQAERELATVFGIPDEHLTPRLACPRAFRIASLPTANGLESCGQRSVPTIFPARRRVFNPARIATIGRRSCRSRTA